VQLGFQFVQINTWRRTALEIGHLAINASPVACIVGIEIDANGNTASAT
jgi:hypothetical protein